MNASSELLSTIKTIDTPLKLLAFVVVVFAVVGGVVLPTSSVLVQLTTIVSLGLIVVISLVVVYSKWDLATTQVDPILGPEHLPLHPMDVRTLRTGQWYCEWTARNVHDDLKPYADDTVTIIDVDRTTGVVRGYGTPVYENADGYQVNGRVSKKGYAHLYYKSGWPHAEKMGMIILKFDFQQGTAQGWWLGGLRETGFLISGGVTWTKDAVYEGEWENRYHSFDYYDLPTMTAGVGDSDTPNPVDGAEGFEDHPRDEGRVETEEGVGLEIGEFEVGPRDDDEDDGGEGEKSHQGDGDEEVDGRRPREDDADGDGDEEVERVATEDVGEASHVVVVRGRADADEGVREARRRGDDG